MYKQLLTPDGSKLDRAVLRLSDNAFIPMAEDNIDYQAYLKWLEEGNTPEPAENT
jgi:hypothetical protein